ncbi:Sortilin, neurotensin receptor 3 [Rhizobiales bacterium GAS188]|nr:Sortilin, neurotensin receptor 3 [Rhizobiales bacterium GAS188]
MPEFWVYAGLAGDTDPGRFLSAGLYRSRNAGGTWESLAGKFGQAPQVRAILTHPRRQGQVTIGTETGIWRSEDAGDTWRSLGAPKPDLAVWSLACHPRDRNTIFAGYEPCAIYRSGDDGVTWEKLPVEVTFPEITMHPEPMPKRVLSIAVDPANPSQIYAGIEIGGLLRSLDGGRSWNCVTEGLYLNEDSVDIHSVVVGPNRTGAVTAATRIGTFRSADRGLHWRNLQVPPLRPRGTYCRSLAYAPDDPETLYLAGGNDFDGDRGALFVSHDDGNSWEVIDVGAPLKTTVFAVAIDADRPDHIFCTTKIGQVFHSADRGKHWHVNPLPRGVGHVFALAVG